MSAADLLPADWNPKLAADRVLAGLVNICRPCVKGAHDVDFLILDGKAWLVYMANDVRHGEAANWPEVYNELTVVDLATLTIERTEVFAASEMAYANVTLPVGACFVPRIIQKDADTLRVFFSSEQPGVRQSQTWYRDLDLRTGAFAPTIHPMELETPQGVFPMSPGPFHAGAAAAGFPGKATDFGLYMIDGFKTIGGEIHMVLNNYPGGLLAWAKLSADMTRAIVLGYLVEPYEAKLTETAVNQMPDGSFLAISRQEQRDKRYMFSTSLDGHTWSPHVHRDDFQNCWSSKSNLDFFGDTYYIGWQDGDRIDGAHRSIFNLDVSRDGETWVRKYRFETPDSFQYATFRSDGKAIWVAVTQGTDSGSRKERISFGKLEDL